MIKQTRKPIQLTKSMLINILRDMEAKHLKSATIYDRDSEEHVILSIEEIKYLIDSPNRITDSPQGTEIFGGTKSELESVFDLYVSSSDYFQYENITVIRNHGGIIFIRCHYPI